MSSRVIIFFSVLIFFGVNLFSQTDHWETAVYETDNWRYIVPTAEPDTNWRKLSFVPTAAWLAGQGGFGYGDNDDNTTISNTRSVYIRINFTITDTSKITEAILNADYDDGFVAYLNNVEIARVNMPAGGILPYNTLASSSHEAVMYSGGNPDYLPISSSLLNAIKVNGNNVLAIQAHNFTANSADLSSRFWLHFGIRDTGTYFGTTPTWFDAPFTFTSSDLPIVVVNTNGQSIQNGVEIVADMGVIYNGPGQRNYLSDSFNVYDNLINIEIRGQSSAGFPQKQYHVETRDSNNLNLHVPFFGMPAENDWILYAPYNDKSLMRNVLTYKLARDMGHWAARTRFCEMMLNGVYNGVYVFMEKIKRDPGRVNIQQILPSYTFGNYVTGGYIFSIDKDPADWTSPIPPNNSTNGQTIQFHYVYPDPLTISPQQETYLQAYVDSFEQALADSNFQHPLTGYRKYAEVKSFSDYFLLNELSNNVDGYRLSTYLHKERDSHGGLIKAGPVWDYNLAWHNANYCDGDRYDVWTYQFNSVCSNDYWQIPFWWDRLVQDSAFQKTTYCRWQELRSTILDTVNLFAAIDSMAQEVDEAQHRHFQQFPILGNYVWPNPSPLAATFPKEIRNTKDWIVNRLAWLDSNMIGQSSGPCVNPTLSTPELKKRIKLQAYPNPFQDQLLLNVDIPKAGNYVVELYNSWGQKIQTISNDEFSTENYSFQLNLQSLQLERGVYIIRVSGAADYTATLRLVKE
jgi:hypothetical protein